MKTRGGRMLAMLFLLLCAVGIIYYNAQRPRILVLHSYDPEYSWTRDIDQGLHRVLDNHSEWSVRWHYMDLKRHPWPEFRDASGQRARRAIDAWRPTVVIAVDDDAQRYAAKFYVGRADIQIVFAGINGDAAPYGYESADNVTGILERKPLRAVREALLESGLPHQPLRIKHIGDTSASVKEDDKFIRAYDWSPLQLADSQLVVTFDEWQAAVLAAKDDADVLLLTNYRRLQRSSTDKTLVPAEEVVKWTEDHSPLPRVGTNGFYVEDGGMLAIGTSGLEQGEVAARMAERVLGGALPREIDIQSSRQYVVYLRAAAMARHGMRLPNVYEAFARALNHYHD